MIIGDGADKERVQKRVEDEKINNVIMLPFQPYEDTAHVFSLGDVGLIISKPGVGNNSVPSKTWSIMAARKPVLASFDSDSELCKLIDQIGCGKYADARDKEGLKEAIRFFCKVKNSNMGSTGLSYINEYANKEKCVAAYVAQL